jgi:hypothetical protein
MLLTAIMSCHKNQGLWSALLQRTGPNAIIFCGGAPITKRIGNILLLECADTYEGLPEKMIALMRYITTDPSFSHVTHILKIDDHDTFCTSEVAASIDISGADYVGQRISGEGGPVNPRWHFGKVTRGSYWDRRPYAGQYVPWLDGGCAYILSRRAMGLCVVAADRMGLEELRRTEIYEDLMVAKMLYPHGILPQKRAMGIATERT